MPLTTDEGESLLPRTTRPTRRETDTANTTKTKATWYHYHTICAILIRIVGDILYKNIVVFYEDYRQDLNLSMVEFSIVIISQQLGALLAMVSLPFITRIIPSLHHKMCIFGLLTGILSIAIAVSPTIAPNNTTFILTLTCIDRFLASGTFYIYITSILDLASKCNDENSGKQGRIVALLNLSWSLASLFYFVTGYTIEFINWWFAFVLFGGILCIMSIISYFVYHPFHEYGKSISTEPGQTTETVSWLTTMQSVICRQTSLLIFSCSLIMGCFTSSYGIIVASVWFEDIYGLNSFQVGLVAFAIFGGELTGCMVVTPLIDKCGVFKCAVLSYGCILAVCVAMFVLSLIFGPNIGGMVIAIICLFVLFFGWEIFFIHHILLCIQNAPSKKDTSLMLMMNYLCITVGGMGGSALSTLWDDGDGMSLITVLWIVLVSMCSFIYLVLYCITNRIRNE